jgi:hypothetical protein
MNNPIFWISAGVVLVSSLWVAIDARRNRVPTHGNEYNLNTGAFAWFVGCLLLWIVVFPVYLFRRSGFARGGGEPQSLEEENRQLKKRLARMKEEVARLREELAQFKPGDTGQSPKG